MRLRTGFSATLVAVGVIAAIAASGAEATTYTYTGSEQTFAVPPNVTGVNVVVVGGQGASCCGDVPTEEGGAGGKLTADVPLAAGTSTLYVEVGGMGTAGSGGWNGGGGGPSGGGGASDIRTVSCSTSCATGGSAASLNSRLAVAGGGGGASEAAPGANSGGSAGPLDLGGDGATLDAPGLAASAGDVTSYCQGQGDQNGEVGNDGDLGLGGAGAYLFLTGTPESGGGGGGWYGGAGGGQCYDSGAVATANAGAGGGGSSGAPTSQDPIVDCCGPIEPAEVIITAPVPSATTTPTVVGGLAVGDVLNETHAQWTSPSQPVTGYTYQWELCNASGASCTAINGAESQTYTLVAGDLGDTIGVQETAENFYGTSAAPSTSAPSGVVGEPPISTAPPTISGTTTDGQVLLETHGTWTGGPITGYGYQWERCSGGSCTAISGAVNQAYTLTAADVGSTIEVQETATNAYGTSAPATSAATSTVQPPPTAPPAATTFTLLGSATASATGVSFSVLCRAAAGTICRGSAQLTTLERLLGGKTLALLASAKRHSKRVLVGSKSFTLAAGAQTKIVVSLNGLGHKLLIRFRRIPATLTIALLNTTPPTEITAQTTIRPEKHKKKH